MQDSADAASAVDLLRTRLIELRADALAQLAAGLPGIDSGLMRVVADASAVLAALESDAEACVASVSDSAGAGI